MVHRDLKPENLLLSDPSDGAILKIADFGLSAIVFAAEASSAAGALSAQQDGKESKESGAAKAPAPPHAKGLPAHEAADKHHRTPPLHHGYPAVTANGNVFLTPTKTAHPLGATGSPLGPPLSPATPQADLAPGALRRLKSVVGSPHYIAPEIASNGMLLLVCCAYSR